MPNSVTGTGNTFNLPNFAGELFTASPTRTPFLSMIGGLSGGRKTDNDRFVTGQLYEFPEAAQPETPPPGRRSVPASNPWVPASAGLLLGSVVVRELLGMKG